jgi:hypothetical protein
MRRTYSKAPGRSARGVFHKHRGLRWAPRAEELESRHLLSGVTGTDGSSAANGLILPAVQADRWYGGGGWWGGWGGGGGWWGGGGGLGGGGQGGGGRAPTAPVSAPPSGAYSPSAILQAYGFNQIGLPGGAAANGAGQTIAIVDAYNDPNIASDLATFDNYYHINNGAAANLTILNQSGQKTGLPATDASWAQETSLDVEWAHAIAPGANIVLVEANSSSVSDLMAAVKTAAHLPGVSVVSLSWGSNEFASETSYDATFNVPGVTFVAASGDGGSASGAQWPAVSPNVVGVGGTSLSTGSGGMYSRETPWSGVFSGGGGGLSRYEAAPSYQSGLATQGRRSSPDVAYDANPNTGFAVYDSLAYQGSAGWLEVGGTSAGAPQWAALVAIADQGRALAHPGTASALSSQQTLTDLYKASSASTTSAFHNVLNAFGLSPLGFNQVTGLGTPVANVLVGDLVGATTTTASAHVSTLVKTAAVPASHSAPIQSHPHLVPANFTVSVALLQSATLNDATAIGVSTPTGASSNGATSSVSVQGSLTTANATPSGPARGQSLVPGTGSSTGTRLSWPEPSRRLGSLPAPWEDEADPFGSQEANRPTLDLEPLPAEANALPPGIEARLDALDRALLSEAGSMPQMADAAPAALLDDAASSVQVSLAGAVAVVLWSAWAVRSDRGERDTLRKRRIGLDWQEQLR